MAQPVRIVVGEDDVLMREGMIRLLADAGFDVVGQAGDAEELLRKALAHRPDVIVLDLVMPGMTGFQVVRQLRDHPDGRNIPILVFTGKELTAEDRAQLLVGVQAVVRKDGAAELLMELARVCPAARQPAA